MKKTQRRLGLLLCLVMVMSLVPTMAFAVDAGLDDGLQSPPPEEKPSPTPNMLGLAPGIGLKPHDDMCDVDDSDMLPVEAPQTGDSSSLMLLLLAFGGIAVSTILYKRLRSK